MFNSSNSKAYGVLYDRKNNINEETWSGHVLKKITDILKTHVLQIDLQPIESTDKGKKNYNYFVWGFVEYTFNISIIIDQIFLNILLRSFSFISLII